jgi:RNA polymerase sigma factor (TIGR02999 family)
MPDDRKQQITRILNESPESAAEDLLPMVYAELRAMAKRRMARERPGQTLQATALVHEAFLRLVGDSAQFENRRHFFAAAAEAMRRILIEQARRKSRIRHGGEQRRTATPPEEIGIDAVNSAAMLDLDEALTRLEGLDEAMANVVKLRYFAGLSIDETASSLDISTRTVNRLWTAARAWLSAELADGANDDA